jgi:DNA ligase-1
MNAQGVKDDKHFDALMADDNYIAQEKLDGMRAVVHVTETGLRIFSRSAGISDPTRPLEKTASLPHLASLRFPSLVGSVFDCEILAEGIDCANISGAVHTKDGGKSAAQVKLYVFDVLMAAGGKSVMHMVLGFRMDLLMRIAPIFVNENIVHVPWVRGSDSKRDLYKMVLGQGGEGIMLKNLNATYQQGGRPSKNWYKKKKHAQFDCVVMGFTKGEGKYNDQIGAVEFGQFVKDKLTKIGQTSGMSDRIRAAMTERPEGFIGQTCIIEGMERLKSGAIRHPQWGGLSDKKSKDCRWYEGEQ